MNSEVDKTFEDIEDTLIKAMIMSPSSHKFYLEKVTRLYIKITTMVCSIQEDSPDCSVKEFTEGFTEAVKRDILASVAKTCEVNGWEFHPDRNAELRKEILDES